MACLNAGLRSLCFVSPCLPLSHGMSECCAEMILLCLPRLPCLPWRVWMLGWGHFALSLLVSHGMSGCWAEIWRQEWIGQTKKTPTAAAVWGRCWGNCFVLGRGSADELPRYATFSNEMRVKCHAKNCENIAILIFGGNPFARNACWNTILRFQGVGGNPFAQSAWLEVLEVTLSRQMRVKYQNLWEYCDFNLSVATLSREMRFKYQKRREHVDFNVLAHRFRTKGMSSAQN